jgi:hypothetical protein
MTIGEIDSALTAIAVMERQELIQQLQSFDGDFPLDFSDDYLASQDTERLRHILMAAYLQQKTHACLTTVLSTEWSAVSPEC